MKKKSIKINFLMNMILTMSSFVFPLITFPYVSRILMPTGTGKVSFASAIVSYFSMIAQLGIPTYGIRACAKVRDNREKLTRTVQELLIINVVMCIFSYIIFFTLIEFVPRLSEDKALYIIVGSNIILTSIGMEWLYKAFEQYTYIALRSIFFKFISLIAMFILIHNDSDYVIYGGITIFAASASNIINFINVHHYIDLKPVGNYNFRKHIKPICTFFAMACATTIYTNLDNVMLGFMTTDEVVGYYNAAVKIKNILVSIVTSLGVVLLPRASYYIENGMFDSFKEITKKSFSFVVVLATPLMFYFILFAKNGIFFLSGDAYAGSVLPMRLIMPTLLLIGLSNILGMQILVPLGKERIVLYSEIVGAVVDVLVNAILIPSYGASGAAIGTTLAEFVVLTVQYVSLKGDLHKVIKQLHYIRIGAAILIGTVASAWVKLLNLNNFFTLLTSFVFFFGTYVLYLFLRKEDIIVEIWNITISKVLKLMSKES